MIKLVNQELFKLRKKKSTFIIPLLLVAFIIVVALIAKKFSDNFDPKIMISDFFGGSALVTFIMIASASTIISMESQYGTLKNLLYRKYSRGEVLASKWITLVIYSLFLYALVAITTLAMKALLFSSISLSDKLEGNVSLSHMLTAGMVGNYIALWLILSLVLMIACFINSSGASIAIGIVFYFASNIISGIMLLLIQKYEWLKWNPFNMLSISGQLQMESVSSKLTHLSTNQLLLGNAFYIIIFLLLGYIVFKRKNV